MMREKTSQDGLLKRLKRFVLSRSGRSRLFGQAGFSGINSGRAGVVDKGVPLTRREVGSRGERLAVDFLKGLGYKIVQMNFRCRQGEIDIIAQQGECLVFVEVRTKKSCDFGTPEESVTFAKREKLISLANIYLQTLDSLPPSWRIDVVAVELTPDDKISRLEHIENAIS
ncbi:MAG: YraN family protein [Dehalococcoidia bacterium]